ALFRYVQNINNESEQLEEQTNALQQEQQRYSDELKEGSANMRKRLIESLEETRQKILKENTEYERLRQNAQREFGPIARAVDKLYNSLGCNEMIPPSAGAVNASSGKNDDQNALAIRMSSMNDLLAAHGITEGNILQFLAIIEQLSTKLTMSQQAIRAQNDYIFNLQVQMDKYTRLVSSVNLRIKTLEDEYRSVQEKVAALRLKRNEGDQRGGGINAVKSMIMCETREVNKLENRLAACRTRESKLVAINADLKKKIDALRANRLFTQTVFEKNQKRLRDIQRQMQETFKHSTNIMAERDKVIAQAHTLANVNIEEQEGFDEIYQNLATIIAREKESADAFRKEALKSETLETHDEGYLRGNYRIDEEAEMKQTLEILDNSLREDKAAIETVSERLKFHESTFKQIMKLVNCDDYHKLVDIYTKKEEENFALFRYVQNINNESEQLEEQTNAL
ncbi:hypothetical protein THRCLA_00175, partial [Thraustotheca clavata]